MVARPCRTPCPCECKTWPRVSANTHVDGRFGDLKAHGSSARAIVLTRVRVAPYPEFPKTPLLMASLSMEVRSRTWRSAHGQAVQRGMGIAAMTHYGRRRGSKRAKRAAESSVRHVVELAGNRRALCPPGMPPLRLGQRIFYAVVHGELVAQTWPIVSSDGRLRSSRVRRMAITLARFGPRAQQPLQAYKT